MDFENLKTATISANQEEVDRILQQMTKSYETESGTQTQTINQQMKKEIEIAKYKKEQLIETQGEINEETEKLLNSQVEIVANSLKNQTQKIENLTPEVVEAWRALGENNYEIYRKKVSQLSPEVQKEVQKMTGVIVQETNNAVPKVEKASNSIYEAITKDLKGNFKIDFGVNVDFKELKSKLKLIKLSVEKMSRVPILGSAFKGISGNIDSLINQLTVNGYESGGFPVSGEMFLARENGLPEMVGKIGNKTSVANNGQIIEGIKAGVYEAVMTANAQNGSTRVNLDVRADEGIIVKKASKGFTEYVEQTGELPFPVPV